MKQRLILTTATRAIATQRLFLMVLLWGIFTSAYGGLKVGGVTVNPGEYVQKPTSGEVYFDGGNISATGARSS